MIPRIETERLILRQRTMADFPAYAAMWADPAVVRHFAGGPLSEEAAWSKFARMEGFWRLCGYGFWLVEEKISGAMIGEVGLAEFKRDIDPPLGGKPEFGWVLASAAHGKGYAREAVAASIAWGEAKFQGAAFSCIIDPENTPSIRLATAFGFREAVRARYLGKEVIVYHRPMM